MTSSAPPTLTINSALLIESNPIFAQLAVRVGTALPRSEFFAALVDFLQQLSKGTDADGDVQMDSPMDQSIAHKKRKRTSGDETKEASEKPSIVIPFDTPHLRVSKPPAASTLEPLPLTAKQNYSHLPQQVILYIFEYDQKSLTIGKGAARLCRFRSQVSERQFHLQYRSLVIYDSTILEQNSNMVVKWIFTQVRRVEFANSLHVQQLSTISKATWPHLCSIDGIRVPLDIIGEQISPFAKERVACLELYMGNRQGIAQIAQIAAQLPNVKTIIPRANIDDNCFIGHETVSQFAHFKKLQRLTASFLDEQAFITLLRSCPSITKVTVDYSAETRLWKSIGFEIGGSSTQLRRLYFEQGIMLSSIPPIPSLVYLSINFDYQRFDFTGIDQLKQLEHFELASKDIEEGDDITYPTFVGAQSLTRCQSLSKLVLCGIHFSNAREDHQQLFSAITKLNKRGQLTLLSLMIFRDVDSIFSLEDIGLGQKCQLRSLKIIGHTLIGSINPLSECKYLSEVEIDHVPGISIEWNIVNPQSQ